MSVDMPPPPNPRETEKMNVNIPPYPTPPHHQTKTGKRKKDNKTPRRPAAPMAASHVATLPSTETVGN